MIVYTFSYGSVIAQQDGLLHQGTPSPGSSANSSQDSLHQHSLPQQQQQKKRSSSIKNSFGRLFNKKDKTAGKMKNILLAEQQDHGGGVHSMSDPDGFAVAPMEAGMGGTLDRKDRLTSDFDRKRKKKYISLECYVFNFWVSFVEWSVEMKL